MKLTMDLFYKQEETNQTMENMECWKTIRVSMKNTGRNYILMEKEQEYVDIINKRLEPCQK